MTSVCGCGCTKIEHREKGPHLGAYCMDCGKWLRWEPKPISLGVALEFAIPFGKHRGQKLRELPDDYLDWLYEHCDDAKISALAQLVYEARHD